MTIGYCCKKSLISSILTNKGLIEKTLINKTQIRKKSRISNILEGTSFYEEKTLEYSCCKKILYIQHPNDWCLIKKILINRKDIQDIQHPRQEIIPYS